jgi:putative mRNA 3-end processing factor
MALHVYEHRIGLDVKDPDANINFVSHAHSDHTSGIRKNSLTLCSAVTKELIEVRSKYGLKMADKPDCISLLNSGHMLGSRQLYINSEVHGCSVVYTGDYQLQKSFASEPIEIRQADVLMMDSTYPYANVVFDEREEVVTSIQRYVRYKERMGCVAFGAYAMGKAQELIGICNDAGIEPVVDAKIARMSEVYNRNGFRLKFQEAADVENHFDSSVMIVTMGRLEEVKMMAIQKNRKVFTAVATGFAKMQRFFTDVQFALSDHADFEQAVQYASQASPRTIYTYGSNAQTMAKNLKSHGYNAIPFDVKMQIEGYQLALLKH